GASFGSIFKNPKNDFAGRLIEAVGLKGFSKGDAMLSDKHANFLINKKNASFEDAFFLIELARKKVFEEFGINLENEVIII
ncbi:UDP-N-acetylmuramate dehydrogenase, partial [Campylobacter jejuni]|nr:UDP-N-acetylmuramate dehydrogenase [Campylobacter jejuni]